MGKGEQTGPADAPSVEYRLLSRLSLVLESAMVVRNILKRPPHTNETGVVFGFLQERNRLPGQCLQLVDRLGGCKKALTSDNNVGNQRSSSVPSRSRSRAHRLSHCHSFVHGWLQ
jgi:hypothetical protein